MTRRESFLKQLREDFPSNEWKIIGNVLYLNDKFSVDLTIGFDLDDEDLYPERRWGYTFTVIAPLIRKHLIVV